LFPLVIVIQPVFIFAHRFRSSPYFRPVSSFGEPPGALSASADRGMLPGITAAGKYLEILPEVFKFH
jgi:hypothetical protein